jgi:hypothetical protein
MKHLTLVIVASILLSGCVRAKGVAYPYAAYAPTDPAKVVIYETIPPVPMEVIGEVSAEGAPAASWERVAEYVKEDAAKLGGDAVILLVADQPFAGVYYLPGQTTATTSGTLTTWGAGGTYTGTTTYTTTPGFATALYRKRLRGVIVRYTAEQEARIRAFWEKELRPEVVAGRLTPMEAVRRLNARELEEVRMNPWWERLHAIRMELAERVAAGRVTLEQAERAEVEFRTTGRLPQ